VDRYWQFLSVSVDYHPVFSDQIEYRFNGQKRSLMLMFKLQIKSIFWKV